MQTSSYSNEEEWNAAIAWLLSLSEDIFNEEPVLELHGECEDGLCRYPGSENRIGAWLRRLPEDLSDMEPVLEPFQEDEGWSDDCMPDSFQNWPTLPEGWPRHLAYHPAMYQELLAKAYGA